MQKKRKNTFLPAEPEKVQKMGVMLETGKKIPVSDTNNRRYKDYMMQKIHEEKYTGLCYFCCVVCFCVNDTKKDQ